MSRTITWILFVVAVIGLAIAGYGYCLSDDPSLDNLTAIGLFGGIGFGFLWVLTLGFRGFHLVKNKNDNGWNQ